MRAREKTYSTKIETVDRMENKSDRLVKWIGEMSNLERRREYQSHDQIRVKNPRLDSKDNVEGQGGGITYPDLKSAKSKYSLTKLTAIQKR